MSPVAAETRRLVLLRHGETDHNRAGRAQGHLDVDLNALGRTQATAVAPSIAVLRPAWIRSSDLSRAAATAAAVGEQAGLPVTTDARFREFHVGTNREGRTWAEYAAEHPDEAAVLLGERPGEVPGRESPADILARWRPALSEALADVPPGGTGLVVAHGAAIRLAVFDLLGLDAAQSSQAIAPLGNCAWAVLAETVPVFADHGRDLRWRLEAWNRSVD